MGEHDASTTDRRLALLVLGMHRSGTSALAGLLGLCGASLPRHLIPANPRNPKGFFESEPLYRLHDELFAEAQTAWHDLSPFPVHWLDSQAGRRWATRLDEAVAEEFGDSPFFVLKDPRLCRLVPFWERVLAGRDTEARYVLTVRDPLETARSLERSEGLPEAVGLLLWLEYFLGAERDTRGAKRCFVSYADLLGDWRPTLDRMQHELDVGFLRRSRDSDAEIDAFLSREHRNQVVGEGELDAREDVHAWIKQAHAWARRAAAGEAPDPAELDPLREALGAAETAFGPALAASEVRRREHAARLDEAGEALLARDEEIASQREEIRELRARNVERVEEIGEKTHELGRLTGTIRMLMRWVVDRSRSPEEPVPPALKASLDAIAKLEPSEIPGLASTSLLLSEQTLQIRQLEAERRSRAAGLEQLAARVARSDGRLETANEDLAERDARLARATEAASRLRADLDRANALARAQRALAAGAARERDRLVQECARLLRRGEPS